MPIQDTYTSLLDRGRDCLEGLIASASSLAIFTTCDSYQSDFTKLGDTISDRPESQIMLLAQREYQYALYALAIGNYRHAFISLRLFFELSLAAMEFSAHEIKYRRWVARLDDIVWGNLTNSDTGVFSDSFIRPFFPGLASSGKQYGAIASKVYRECSEYVHGSVHTHPDIAAKLEFSAELLATWAEKTDTIRRCVIFAFSARHLKFISAQKRNTIETIVLEVLGDVPEIQAQYQVP